MRLTGRLTVRALAVGITVALAPAVVVPAVLVSAAQADPGGPSQSRVDAAKAEAARRAQQVAQAAAAIDRTQAKLDQLNTTAEVAIETYDGARVKLDRATKAEQTAQLVLSAAAERVSAAKAKLQQFAAASYKSGGALSTLQSLLTADGPATLLDRASTLNAISRSQQNALEELDAAQTYQRVVERKTAAVLADRKRAADAADRAQRAARTQVEAQTATLHDLTSRQAHFQQLLRAAEAKAGKLERDRLAAIARARAEAAARRAAAALAAQRAAAQRAAEQAAAAAAAQQAASSSSSSSSSAYAPPPPPADSGAVVSADTENAAVAVAYQQLGKPYVWGAEGPDSYDCSGLTMYSYAQVGVHMDHWTGYQWNEGIHIASGDARPGDLFFFATDTSNPDTIHHVGMYVGNGQMIEAPYTGANVRVSSAYRSDLIGVVRPFAR
jgi:cell wall-associated NlpC family hydrolase